MIIVELWAGVVNRNGYLLLLFLLNNLVLSRLNPKRRSIDSSGIEGTVSSLNANSRLSLIKLQLSIHIAAFNKGS